jgi:hypothetical protein
MKKTLFNIFVSGALLIGITSSLFAGVNGEENNKSIEYNFKTNDVVELIKSIPSPLETTFLLKEMGTAYKKSNLNNPDFVGNYSTSFDQALNLGAYGTDLGFATIYNKNQDVLNYLESVKKLADQLSIGQHFNIIELSKMTKDGKIDELMLETTKNLEKINGDLQASQREYVSILLVTGGWIEANYLSSLVYTQTKDAKLKERLGEQKLVVSKIVGALSVYKTKPRFAELITDMEALQAAFANVSIVNEEGKAVTKVVNGELVTETVGGKYEVKASDADMQAISTILKKIRTKIVK